MKRCPKCSRTYPDESQKFCTVDGGLLISDPVFDPNVTIRATAADVAPPLQPQQDIAATSRELPDLNATIATTANSPTVAFPRNTGPTGTTTASDIPPPPLPRPSGISTMPGATTHPPQAKKKSKLPLILGAVALVLLLGVVALAGVFFYVVKPLLEGDREEPVVAQEAPPAENTNTNTTAENTNTNTSSTTEDTEVAFVPPEGTTKFANSATNMDEKLAEHYVDFSFYYPETWQTDKSAGVAGASNFVKVQKTLEDDTGDYLLESATVSWYNSSGTFESDLSLFPDRARNFSAQLSAGLPGYEKVSEGPTQINALKGYEFRFKGVFQKTGKGDLPYWGRAIFLPPGSEGEKNGVVIVLLATSLAPQLSGVEDVGAKGDMPIILESFRFAKK